MALEEVLVFDVSAGDAACDLAGRQRIVSGLEPRPYGVVAGAARLAYPAQRSDVSRVRRRAALRYGPCTLGVLSTRLDADRFRARAQPRTRPRRGCRRAFGLVARRGDRAARARRRLSGRAGSKSVWLARAGRRVLGRQRVGDVRRRTFEARLRARDGTAVGEASISERCADRRFASPRALAGNLTLGRVDRRRLAFRHDARRCGALLVLARDAGDFRRVGSGVSEAARARRARRPARAAPRRDPGRPDRVRLGRLLDTLLSYE